MRSATVIHLSSSSRSAALSLSSCSLNPAALRPSVSRRRRIAEIYGICVHSVPLVVLTNGYETVYWCTCRYSPCVCVCLRPAEVGPDLP